MITYYFVDRSVQEALWSLAGRKKCDPRKTVDKTKTQRRLIFEGIRAEYGFCEILGIPFDWRDKNDTWGDDCVDFKARNKTCQMKYNNWRPPKGELYFRKTMPWKPHLEIAILSVPVIELVNDKGKGETLGGIEYVGWTDKPTFDKYSRPKIWPGDDTPTISIHAGKLFPIEELISLLKEIPRPRSS